MRWNGKWISHVASAASILSFLGATISWWAKRPLLSGLGLGLCAGLLAGAWLERRKTARSMAEHAGAPAPDKREAALDVARAAAARLTSEAWGDFPTWGWSIATSKHALQVAMERAQERVTAGMTSDGAEAIVHESIRMFISETLARRAAAEQAQAMAALHPKRNWVTGWRE